MSTSSRRAAWVWLIVAATIVGASTLVFAYREAVAAPIVRHLALAAADYPRGAKPMRLVLFSDLHVHGPDMPPARVERIVGQINALHPDLVIATGDFVGGGWFGRHYAAAEAIAPMRALKARYGVYAVLGNNDYQPDAAGVRMALEEAGVRLLVNATASVGPLAIGGIDGELLHPWARWVARRKAVHKQLARTAGVKVLLAHRSDEFEWAPAWVTLTLAGHTHCGQIVLPLVGALLTGSDFGQKYSCGIIRHGGSIMVVTAGLGTSRVPLRIGAPPELWVIDIGAPLGERDG